MTINAHIENTPDLPDFAPRFYGIGILVAAIVSAGIYFTARFNDADLARDMQAWREKLNLITESRASDIDHWVSGNFKELRALADNPSAPHGPKAEAPSWSTPAPSTTARCC